MRLLNLGCGTTWHPGWVNVDLAPAAPGILAHDLGRPLPFADCSFDAVYHAHVLEHLDAEDAAPFIKECVRVVKPGGIVRVVVPDLEAICRLYAEKLDGASAGDAVAAADYDWIVLELYDQAARKFKGGLMGRHLKSAGLANEDFIKARVGAEMWNTVRQQEHSPSSGLMARISRLTLRYVVRRVRERMAGAMVGIIAGGRARKAFQEGTFRARGEVHRWMYDRYSLGRLMMDSGLRDVAVCGPTESRIAGFADYGLDVRNGEERKPDSIYMEGLS